MLIHLKLAATFSRRTSKQPSGDLILLIAVQGMDSRFCGNDEGGTRKIRWGNLNFLVSLSRIQVIEYIVQRCMVLNIESWNRTLPGCSVRRRAPDWKSDGFSS